MQRLFSAKPLLAIAIAAGSLAAASGAHATSVSDGVMVHIQAHRAQPAPVYVQPAPVYVQPVPVHAKPRVVQPPRERYESRGAWGDADHDGVPNRYDRRDDRVAYRTGWADNDRDGVPNRYDRAPNNPHRR